MKKFLGKKFGVLLAATLAVSNISVVPTYAASSSRQVEALDRGLVGIKTNEGVYLSWRLLGTENYNTAFNVYKNGNKIAGPITDSTNYVDKGGKTSDKYTVRTVVNGVEKTESDAVTPWNQNYFDVPISKPGSNYSANDASVADVDGDGQYEIILKWDPSDSKDNSQAGKTSPVYIDCYELTGQRLWRINLGINIRAGAHYTQFIAYDFDGDGKAEVAMKTADGTVAGDGKVIGDKSKNYRNSKGYILDGPEYLTIFEGATGKAIDTINYEPARGNVSSWGDSYGNRVDRFLASVAYLDGKKPSLIICRGYYTRSVIVAYDLVNGKLKRRFTFDTNHPNNKQFAGQGNHSLSIADVDSDGCDEIVYGSAVIDNNGWGMYSTGNGHGDALHVGDFDPNRAGLEIFQVHEDKSSHIESVQMRDAKTGKTIWSKKTGTDVGRGIIANIGPDYYPYIVSCSAGNFDSKGNPININLGKFGQNFLVWWDGDLYREGLDKNYINKWNWNTKGVDRLLTADNVHSNNGTKSTPSLSADIFGDWREEVIWPTANDSALRIYMSTAVTNHKLYTFMHDTQYRTAIAWQNVGYNQPPHPSFYVGEDMATPSKPNVYTVGSYKENTVASAPTFNAANIKEGTYMIKSASTDKYLDVVGGKAENGTNVQLWGASGSEAHNTWTIKSAGNGYYKIYSKVGNGEYLLDLDRGLTANKTNIQIYKDTKSDAQLFKFVKQADGTYSIHTKASKDATVLDIAGASTDSGANIQAFVFSGGQNQKWILEEVKEERKAAEIPEGEYMIKSELSGKYLDVTNGKAENGTNVQLWSASSPGAYNTWRLKSAGYGYYKIYSKVGNGEFLLDIADGKADNGANLQIYTDTKSGAQLFKFFKNSDGTYTIATRSSKDASSLDVYNHSKDNGANVCQWEDTGNTNQKWRLEPVVAATPTPTPTPTPVPTQTVPGAVIKEGTYMIKSASTDKYLDVEGGKAANATNVQLWGANGSGKHNTWTIKSVGNGYYKIYSNVGNGEYLLDLDRGLAVDKTNIQIYTDTKADAQLFKFAKQSDGTYAIYTKASKDVTVLDIAGASTENGANIQAFKYKGGQNQKWILEEVTAATPAPTKTPEPTKTPTPTVVPTTAPTAGGANATYTYQSWGGGNGYSGNVTIENKTNTDVASWKLTLFGDQFVIDSAWNVVLKTEGNNIYVTPETWNSVINKNSSVSFGFNGRGDSPKSFNYKLEFYDANGNVIARK